MEPHHVWIIRRRTLEGSSRGLQWRHVGTLLHEWNKVQVWTLFSQITAWSEGYVLLYEVIFIFFLPSHWSFYIISFQDSFKFTNNAKSFFLEVAERVNVSPFQVYNKEESPRDSADDHKPQSPQHVFLTWCQSDISRMMTWLQRSAGDLLCVAANSAAFEKTLDITESLKLTFKHASGFSHQLISAIIIVH